MATASLTGSGAFSATAVGSITPGAPGVGTAIAALAGSGAFTATVFEVGVVTAALGGSGVFAATAFEVGVTTAALAGGGGFTALVGSGDLYERAGYMDGSGSFTATSTTVGVAVGYLGGSGTFTASVAVVGGIVTALSTGAGAFTATAITVGTVRVTANQAGAGAFSAVVREIVPAYLLVVNPAVDQPPATISVVMANLTPLAVVTFRINAVIVGTGVADVQGDVDATTLAVDRQFGVGTHTVSGTTVSHAASSTFTIARAAAALPVTPTPDTPPVLVVDTVDRWVLQDLAPGGLGSWTMPINPSAMTSPHVRKTVGVMATTAVYGRPHVSEGARPVEWEFSGFCPDQAFQNQLIAFSQLPRRFYLIDHRDRAWTVAFASIDIRPRKRTRDQFGQDQDWLADYTVQAVLFSQTPGVPA